MMMLNKKESIRRKICLFKPYSTIMISYFTIVISSFKFAELSESLRSQFSYVTKLYVTELLLILEVTLMFQIFPFLFQPIFVYFLSITSIYTLLLKKKLTKSNSSTYRYTNIY